MSNNDLSIPSASVISKEAGLVVFGAAAGLLLSSTIGNHARKPMSLILAAAGLAAAGPEIAKLVDRVMHSPSNSRGSKKTLESIRYGAGKPSEYVDHETGENMFIG